MRTLARTISLLIAVTLGATLLDTSTASAQSAAPGGAVATVLDSIVKISTTVPSDARTANTLGTEREGSGVVIDGDGLVLTIGYVILEADSIEIGLGGGKTVPATLVAYDHDTGLGLVKASAPLNVAPLELGSSDALAQRQPVLVAGHGGQSQAMGAFVVDRRDFAGYWEYLLENALFTSPPYARFGGAALIDQGGKLVGIGSLIVPNALESDGRALPGNMFIPIGALKPILADLISSGRSTKNNRPWLGIYTQDVKGRLFVGRVPESGPAHAAGIRAGDMVLGVAGKPVDGLADFYRKVWALGDPGVKVPLMILRGNQPTELTVESVDRYDWLKLRPSY